MICPNCDGKGVIQYERYPANDLWVMSYCEECGGSGVVSCCEPQADARVRTDDGTPPGANPNTRPPGESRRPGIR